MGIIKQAVKTFCTQFYNVTKVKKLKIIIVLFILFSCLNINETSKMNKGESGYDGNLSNVQVCKTLKSSLNILYILNVADLIFTLLLIGTGSFMELNILMSKILNNIFLCFFTKVDPSGCASYLYLYENKNVDFRTA